MIQSVSNVISIYGGPQDDIGPTPDELADPDIANALGLLSTGLTIGCLPFDDITVATSLKDKMTTRDFRLMSKFGGGFSSKAYHYLINRGWFERDKFGAVVTAAGRIAAHRYLNAIQKA